jgi:uncharacterized protein YecT (DUF1311 family)
MNGKRRIALLMALAFMLCSTLPAVAADPAPAAAAPTSPKTAPAPAPAVAAPPKTAIPSAKPKASPLAPAARSAPSFNCAKASNAVERAVCADSVLAELDVQVAAEYKKALGLTTDKAALRTNQKQWLRQMHSQCAKVGFQCIQHYYRTRLSQLQQHNEQAVQMR